MDSSDRVKITYSIVLVRTANCSLNKLSNPLKFFIRYSDICLVNSSSLQVENEYGEYFTCDHDYLTYLQDLFEGILGKDKVILFTVNPASDHVMSCGTIKTLFNTVDFGPGKLFLVEDVKLRGFMYFDCTILALHLNLLKCALMPFLLIVCRFAEVLTNRTNL